MGRMSQADKVGKVELPRPADDEVIIEVTGHVDSLGRRQFTAYWVADNVGAHCNERGVRGQNFHAEVAEHAARWQACGLRVTVVGGES